jgi:hypothetical protein
MLFSIMSEIILIPAPEFLAKNAPRALGRKWPGATIGNPEEEVVW